MNPRRKLSCCPESAVVFEQVGFDFMVSRSIAGSLSRSGVAEVMAETAVFGQADLLDLPVRFRLMRRTAGGPFAEATVWLQQRV
jgi:hypothetical protein